MKNRWGVEYTARHVGMMTTFYFTSKREAVKFASTSQGDWDIGRISRTGKVNNLQRVNGVRNVG